jgi:hypothetical protein
MSLPSESQHDWQDEESTHFRTTLKKIEQLRERIDDEGSGSEIGAAAHCSELNHRYHRSAEASL